MIFKQFTTNEIKAAGWLRNQLEIQAKGLSGNLDKMWNSVKESSWIGGNDEGWERVPYWLDGFVPLAYLLDNNDMKARAKKYVEAILERQCEDGWICPCKKEKRVNYDIWACFIICKALVVYADCSGDERIENAVSRALQNLSTHMNSRTLFDWGSARWFECLIPILWLRERKPDDWQLDLIDKLYIQGIDYKKMFKSWRYAERRENWSYLNHVVNIAMMLKGEALMTEIIGGDPNEFAKQAMEILLRDHGMACGHFSGDECLSGTSPVHGSECCSVAEAMYSYEWLVELTGDSYWSERLEKTAFNAFPATVSPDMWTHQYDQLTNQVQCSRFPNGKQPFNTNGEESHIFGLEPNFGCCTANFNQAFPKFAMSTMMKTKNGVAVCAVAPSKVETKIDGAEFAVEIITNYPFEDGYKIKVNSATHDEREILVRIPEKAVSATIDGKEVGVGENGEICIKTGDEHICGLFDGYYGDEEKTREVLHDGFYHTGDVAWRDEDGFLWYVSRVDDVIKSSGYRIGPFEIESVIMELPYVLECGVSAAPDPVRGQVVKASIVLTKGTEGTEDLKKEIQNYVKHKTAPYKYPRIVEFKDELPKTVSGKIIRHLL